MVTFVVVLGLTCAGFARAQTATPFGSATYNPPPGSVRSAPAGSRGVTIHWSAQCDALPSANPADQHYWDVESIALHQDGAQANYESTAEANVNDASGTHRLVLTMASRLRRETFSVRVHLECNGHDIVISQSRLTLVRGHLTGGGSSSGGGGGGGSGGSGSGGGSGGSGSGGSGSGGSSAHCVVPKLAGKTLRLARKLLARAHCRLGKVIAPKPRPGVKLLVKSSSPKAGTRLPMGAKVDIRLRKA